MNFPHVRPLRLGLILVFAQLSTLGADLAPVQAPDGRITFPAAAAQGGESTAKLISDRVPHLEVSGGESAQWNFKPTRWGRYDLEVTYASAGSGAELQFELAGQTFKMAPPATGSIDRYTNALVTRIYLSKTDPFTLRVARSTAGSSSLNLQRVALLPAPEGNPVGQSADGVTTLASRDATTHSVLMRYEPATNKNCLGYWVNPADWADWNFTVSQPGTFDVQVWQGCGTGNGGSDVTVEIGATRLPFVVEETGHFQNFIPRQVGRVTLAAGGQHTLAIKPQRKQGGAVMDIRQIRLIPVQTTAVPAPGARDFVTARRVVVLGDSITYAGGWVELVEAWLHLNFPESPVQFLNLGLPSETVSGLSEPGHAGGSFPRPGLLERLERVLEKTKPDLIIACYGMNDGIYYPFGEERFQKFRQGIRRLREQAAHVGVRVIHVTPPVFDPLPLTGRTLPAGRSEYPSPYEGYNAVLDHYSEWLLSQRVQGWEVIDTHGPMNQFLAEKRRTDPKFILASDGVHANPQGHWLIAREILRALGAPEPLLAAEGPELLLQSSPRGTEVLTLVQQRQNALKDPWLTAVGHLRPGMGKGKPLLEAERDAAQATAKLNASR